MRKKILSCMIAIGILSKAMIVYADPTAYFLEYGYDKWVEDTHYDLIVETEDDDINLDVLEWDDTVSGITRSDSISFHAQISDYVGDDEKLVIPAIVDGVRVSEITVGAFAGNEKIKEVVFQGSIENINSKSCLPETVATCEKGSFEDCVNLERVVFENGMAPASSYAEAAHAFAGCSSLEAFVVENPDMVAGIMSIDGVLYKAQNGVPVELLAYPAGKKDTSFTLPATVNLIANTYPNYEDIFCGNPYLKEIVLESTEYFMVENGVLYTADKSRIVACPAGRNDGTLGLPENLVVHSLETVGEHEMHRVAATNIPPATKVDKETDNKESDNKQPDKKEPDNQQQSATTSTYDGTEAKTEEKVGFFSAAKENIVWILVGVVLEMIHIRIRNKKRRKAIRRMQKAQRRS